MKTLIKFIFFFYIPEQHFKVKEKIALNTQIYWLNSKSNKSQAKNIHSGNDTFFY